MRIAVIHSFYRSVVSSGENNTVLAQVEALRGAGHEVKLIAQYTDENQKRNPFYPLKAGFDVATGNGYDPTPELEKFQPDVVRVHNLFPNFGTKWLEHWKGPIMATLHNYRPVCANGVLFRDGAICTLCPDGKPLSSFKYGCYKNSRLATAALTLQISKGLLANPVIARADKLVVLSKRSFAAYQRFGLDPSRMVIIPDFVKGPDRVNDKNKNRNKVFLVASRLSVEKGVRKLVESWPDNVALDIYGDGDERASIEAINKKNVRLMGQVPETSLRQKIPNYAGMVFSSLTWEGMPGSVLLAFAAGLPVLARAGSVGADLVQEYGFGAVYENESELKRLVHLVLDTPTQPIPNLKEFDQTTWLSKTEHEIEVIVSRDRSKRFTVDRTRKQGNRVRIALIHSFYTSSRPSGENVMVNLQAEALAKAGYQVKLIARYTDELRERNPFYPLKAGIDVSTGLGYDPTAELLDFKPDVAWVHNLFPNFSTKWLAKWQGPLIATLHNYRSVCAKASLFRNGHVCTLCHDGNPLSALKYGCYKNSRLASVPLTIQISKGLNANPLIARADRIVLTSSLSRLYWIRFGLSDQRLEIIPNFVHSQTTPQCRAPSVARWVTAGRMEAEKGLLALAKHWPKGYQLDMYGAGPDEKAIRNLRRSDIMVYGPCDPNELAQKLRQYTGFVYPSIWPEAQGMLPVMALEAGLPVVTTSENSFYYSMTKTFNNQLVFDLNAPSIADSLDYVIKRGERLRIEAREMFEKSYTESAWLERTIALLSRTIGFHVV